MADILTPDQFFGAPKVAPQQVPAEQHGDLIPPDQFFGPATAAAPAQQRPESTSPQSGIGPLDAFNNFSEQARRAATLGLSDKIGGVVHAIPSVIGAMKSGTAADASGVPQLPENRMITMADLAKLSGPGYAPIVANPPDNTPSISDAYHAGLANERQAGETYAENHPVASKVATTLGTLATIPLTGTAGAAPATLGGKMLQSAGQGVAIGGVSGFGGSNDQSLGQTALDTATGATIGGAVGGAVPLVASKVVQPVVDWVARKYGSGALENQSVRQIMDRIGKDQSAGGPSAQDILDLATAAEPSGKPLTIADLAGQNVKGLGERIANTPGPGQQAITSTLNARDVGAGTRLAGDIESGLGTGSAHDTTNALMQARSAAAAPAYDSAFQQQQVWSPRLGEFLDDPIMKAGLKNGLELERIDSVTQGRPFNPTQMGVDLDKEGNVTFRDVPNMRVLDAGKRGLDSMIAAERNPITGRLSQRGVTLDQFRRAYVSQLDNLDTSGTYAAARSAWAGPSASLDAIQSGSTVLNKHPEEIAAEFSKLSPGDQEFYRLGAANALKDKVAKTGMGGDEAKRIIGNQYTQDQLRPLFSDQASYDRFIQAATHENTMFNTRTDTLLNSRTARRAAELANAGGGSAALGHVMQGGLGLAEGAGGSALMSGFRALGALAKGAPNPQVDLATAQRLFTTDPAANRALLARIISQQSAPSALPNATIPLASLSARAVPQLLRGYQGQSQP